MRMLPLATPYSLFGAEHHRLVQLLPGIRDGDVEAIHDARVSSRRLRELIPLLLSRLPALELARLESSFADIMKALGRVRDHDVMIQLLDCIEARMPEVTAHTGSLRAQLRKKRERGMRKTLKRLEALDVDDVLGSCDDVRPAWFTRPYRQSWRKTLGEQVATRARGLREDIDHAGGVYFPNRLHSVRVALKRLRYAVEIANATGVAHGERVVARLKKAQEILGKIHDRQVLAQLAGGDEDAARALVPLLDMQRRELHARYLRRRSELLRIAQVLSVDRRGSRLTSGLVVAAGLPLAVIAVRPLAALFPSTSAHRAPDSTVELAPQPHLVRVSGQRRVVQ